LLNNETHTQRHRNSHHKIHPPEDAEIYQILILEAEKRSLRYGNIPNFARLTLLPNKNNEKNFMVIYNGVN
jgi:hypothetical protein